ncbi:MAG: hypothetical protein DRZ90_12445, partial [Spirochaetes bacterium]
ALVPKDLHFDPQARLSQSEVRMFAKKHELNPAIIAGKIQFARKNYSVFRNLLGRGKVKECFME